MKNPIDDKPVMTNKHENKQMYLLMLSVKSIILNDWLYTFKMILD